MIVSELTRYPLKSGAGETLDSATLTPTGIEFDRHWMVVTGSGRLVSQRDKGAQALALVRAIATEEGAEFLAPDKSALVVRYDTNRKRLAVEVHKNTLQGIDAGDAAAQWFSELLPSFGTQSLRLVHFPHDFTRKTQDRYTGDVMAETQFADGYAALITSRGSLIALNEQLVARGIDPVLMSVFRPNIVIDSPEPWVEDELREISVGDAVLEVIKPCRRCPITGVTQELGTFSKNPKEPRETLGQFHAGKHLLAKFPNLEESLLAHPMFGQNAIIRRPGTIRVGDEIKVLSRR